MASEVAENNQMAEPTHILIQRLTRRTTSVLKRFAMQINAAAAELAATLENNQAHAPSDQLHHCHHSEVDASLILRVAFQGTSDEIVAATKLGKTIAHMKPNQADIGRECGLDGFTRFSPPA